ncbi:hypothetical protein SAMN05216268_1497 [Streptomyces yunnanensis]|uniref:Uncharacterized protein n=1 Tax=Streptomyces yunnanensis TaxID=156453 RepID=A0A9X8N9P3_9ACTN|nr:hypothetical protein SAMN05216268_1497 [Streptomyces yunnanensis]
MPASPTAPASLLAALGKLRVFTARGCASFTAMVTGLVAQTGPGTLTGAGLAYAGRTIGPTPSFPGHAGTLRSWGSRWRI